MIRFKYFAFEAEDVVALQERLTDLGKEGWRLHTCQPSTFVSPQNGSLMTIYAVVMDQAFDDGEGPLQGNPQAMKCVG